MGTDIGGHHPGGPRHAGRDKRLRYRPLAGDEEDTRDLTLTAAQEAEASGAAPAAAAATAGETSNPQRNIPTALVRTVVFTAFFYFLIVLVFVAVVPAERYASATLVDVGRALAGGVGAMDAQEIAKRTPDDIEAVIDDDIVAKQLREAALAEEDPELRERLWEEYRKYKGM